MQSVVVLLSTYNGAHYLRQQLDSLLNQDYPLFRIRVRDDGSTDDTLAILQEYAGRHAVLEYKIGTNLGAAASFFELLRTRSDDAELVAFCDQDDVWERDKISRAVQWITRGDAGMPRLYFSRLKIVDRELRLLGMTRQPTRPPGFGNALTQNIAAGCTMMLNRQAVRLLTIALPGPRTVVMHDWWIYLVVSAFGMVEYDREVRILYRQHGANNLGARTGAALRWSQLTRVLLTTKDEGATKQLNEFSRIYLDRLPTHQRHLLEIKLAAARSDWRARWRCALSRSIYRQGWVDDLAYRLLIVFGRR